ncbi:MAG: translation initiation factor IF-6 [Desulfurococcaceae archaeon]
MVEISRMSFFGNPNIGIYAFVNDKVLIYPPGIGKDDIEEINSVLRANPIEMKIAGTILNGVFLAGNNTAILIPHIIFDHELEELRKSIRELGIDIELVVLESKYTALGNLVLCNSYGCLASPLIEDKEIKKVENIIGVEVYKTRLVNLDIPGSIAVVNDKGGVIHPDSSDDDLKTIKNILKIDVEHSTVNGGVPYVKSGLLANNRGVVVGGGTTGPEVLRIKTGFEGGVK